MDKILLGICLLILAPFIIPILMYLVVIVLYLLALLFAIICIILYPFLEVLSC